MQEEIKNYFDVRERVALVEQAVIELKESNKNFREDFKEMRTEFRWLIGMVFIGFTGLLAVMAHGFKWI